MAGAGWREWVAGEQLTDAKMQTFLQDQSVMRFADESERTTALNGVVSEGMITYLDDVNVVEVYDGSEWTELTGDPDIFYEGTSGQFLVSSGTAGVAWSAAAANPGTAGVVKGVTGDNDGDGTALGALALNSYSPGGFVVASVGVGSYALRNTTADLNTAVGTNAGFQMTTGQANTIVGYSAMAGETTGDGNTVIGGGAGYRYYNGSNNNTIIGYEAAGQSLNTHTGNNNLVLGYSALPSSESVSNEITLGNSSISALRCQVTSISSLSDERDKKDIDDLTYGVDFLNQLRPVSFVWDMRDGAKVDEKDFGFIAQELAAVEDDNDAELLKLTLRNNPDKLEATPGRLIPILVKAIQELSARIEELENAR